MKIKIYLSSLKELLIRGNICSENKSELGILKLESKDKIIEIQSDRMGNIDDIEIKADGILYKHIRKWEILEASDIEKKLFLKYIFGGLNLKNYKDINSSDDLYFIKF